MKVPRPSGRPLKWYVIIFLLDIKEIDNCINFRNTRALHRFATKADPAYTEAANTTVFTKNPAAAAAIRRASLAVGDGGMTKIDCII